MAMRAAMYLTWSGSAESRASPSMVMRARIGKTWAGRARLGWTGSVAFSVPGQASGPEVPWSHGLREPGECCREAKRRWDVGGKFVVAAAEVLDERVAHSDPGG